MLRTPVFGVLPFPFMDFPLMTPIFARFRARFLVRFLALVFESGKESTALRLRVQGFAHREGKGGPYARRLRVATSLVAGRSTPRRGAANS